MAARYKNFDFNAVNWRDRTPLERTLEHLGFPFTPGLIDQQCLVGCFKLLASTSSAMEHLMRVQGACRLSKSRYTAEERECLRENFSWIAIGMGNHSNDEGELSDSNNDPELRDGRPVWCGICNRQSRDWGAHCCHILSDEHDGQLFGTNIYCPCCDWALIDGDAYEHLASEDHMYAMLDIFEHRGLMVRTTQLAMVI